MLNFSVLRAIVAVLAFSTTTAAASIHSSPLTDNSSIESVDRDDGPGSLILTFGSLEDRGKYRHCAVTVVKNPSDSNELVPGNETCFADQSEMLMFALGGDNEANNASEEFASLRIVPDGLVAIHFMGTNFSGDSVAIVGDNCDGGGVDLTGTIWDNRIQSTANGCSIIEHHEVGTDITPTTAPQGDVEITKSSGGNLDTLSSQVSGVTYGGVLSGTVNLLALEVSQGMQDWQGSVPLIADRPTIVRAFLNGSGLNGGTAIGRLYLDRPGESSLGPLMPLNSGGRITIRLDSTDRRSFSDSSLNFRLPDDWTHEDGTVRLDLIGATPNCFESAAPANTCTASMTFQEVAIPDIQLLKIQTSAATPSNAAIAEQAARLASALPVAALERTERLLLTPFDGTQSIAEVNTAVLTTRAVDGRNSSIYLGLVDGNASGDATSSTTTPSGVAVWTTQETDVSNSVSYARNRGAHLVGTAIGIAHAGDESGNDVCDPAVDIPAGAAPYPYFDSTATSEGIKPFLGPTINPALEMWGVDYRLISQNNSQLGIISPADTWSIMSHCSLTTIAGQVRWTDAYHWQQFQEEFADQTWHQTWPNPSATSWDFVSGMLNFAANGTVQSIDFEPVVSLVPSGPPPTPPTGDYTLKLLNAAGGTITSLDFSPQITSTNSGQTVGSFVLPIQNTTPFATVEISKDGSQLGTLSASGSAPTTAITSTFFGQSPSGVYTGISWTASDADGDQLSHLIQLSTDGGNSFETIAIGFVGNSIDLLHSTYPATTQAQVRIVTSDGVLSTISTSNPFQILSTPPSITILSPRSGSFSTDLQAVTLEASAVSPTDGLLPRDSIEWSSDVDGVLGIGATLVVEGASLTPGVHVLTATATNSANQQATASTTITAAVINKAPIAITDDVITDPGTTIDIDVLANDIDEEHDIDPSTLSIESAPSFGTAEVALLADRTSVIRYSASQPGFDEFTYKTCDGNGGCSSAVLKVWVQGCTITGTEGDDTLVGTAARDVICGLGGDDSIWGLEGDDVIDGGDGNDTINGGDGNDVIDGGNGNDTINGGDGNDVIDGGDGNDVIDGGDGDDVIDGGLRFDIINGGLGDDIINGGDGADTINGGDGADTINGGLRDDTINGGLGDDIIDGGDGDDIIDGGDGDDTINGGQGPDTLDGGSGNDTINGGLGDDIINGGLGDDIINGGERFDIINGGPGDDIINGGDRDDIIDGGPGHDIIDGGPGHDTIDGGEGNDTIDGGLGNDIINGGDGNDIIDGEQGDDIIDGEGDTDSADGGVGNDSCEAETTLNCE